MMSDTGAEFHLCNLTRKGWEISSQDDFRTFIREPFRDRFHVISWEDIYVLTGFYRDRLARLRTYLENKSLNLRQAFQLGRVWNGV